MASEAATAEKLQQLIQDESIAAPNPMVIAETQLLMPFTGHEPDQIGCSWSLHSFRGDHTCAGVVNAIVSSLQQRYNLIEDWRHLSGGGIWRNGKYRTLRLWCWYKRPPRLSRRACSAAKCKVRQVDQAACVGLLDR